jgi:hypothetical protein
MIMRAPALALGFALLLSGCLVGEQKPEGDSDGDYLLDDFEKAGWDIELELRAPRCLTDEVVEKVARHVTPSEHLTDTDFDGVDDAEEYSLGSDPRSNDSDGDGLLDRVERDINLGETVKLGGGLKLNRVDSDRDCLGDWNETHGVDVPGIGTRQTDPTLTDSDEDGLADGQEVVGTHTDPMHPDTDRDGLNDRLDGDPLHNLAVRLVFERFHLKTGSGPVRFQYALDGPHGPVRPTSPPAFTIASGENKSLPSELSPGTVDVQDTPKLPFQFWVLRQDGSVLDIVAGDDGPIVTGEVDPGAFEWSAAGRTGAARGSTAWMSGPDGELAFRLEVVYL